MRRDMRRYRWFRRYEEIVFRIGGVVLIIYVLYELMAWLLS